MKTTFLPSAVRREISEAKPVHITEKQVNDRIKVVIALSIAFVVIAFITIAAVIFDLNIN